MTDSSTSSDKLSTSNASLLELLQLSSSIVLTSLSSVWGGGLFKNSEVGSCRPLFHEGSKVKHLLLAWPCGLYRDSATTTRRLVFLSNLYDSIAHNFKCLSGNMHIW